MPFFHLAQQQHNIFVGPDPSIHAPSLFVPPIQLNTHLNQYPSPEKNPLIEQNQNHIPIINNSLPNPINLGNPNFGAPPIPQNVYPYNNYPNVFPPSLVHQVPPGYNNDQDKGNVYNPEQYNSYDVHESNYLTNPNHDGHQIPPQINPQPQFFPTYQNYNNYNNYGNYGGGY